MVLGIYILIVVLSLFGSILNRKNLLFEFLILVGIIFLMGRGANTLDIVNYKLAYERSPNISFGMTYEKGYLLIQKICNFVNLNYIQFRVLFTIISWFLIRKSIGRFTDKPHFIYLFYLLFAIFIDTVQIRNFIAFALVFAGITHLFLPDKNNKSKFVVIILLATTIHISSVIYLIFGLINVKNKKDLIKFLVFFTILFCVAIFMGGNKVPIVEEILSLINEGRLDAYIGATTKLGFLYAFFLHFFSIVLLYYARKISQDVRSMSVNNSSTSEIEMRRLVIDAIYWINIVAILFFPLYMMNLQFIRLTRNLLILNLVAYSLIQKPLIHQSPKLVLFNFLVFINALSWYYFTFIIQDHVEDIIDPFFSENQILS